MEGWGIAVIVVVVILALLLVFKLCRDQTKTKESDVESARSLIVDSINISLENDQNTIGADSHQQNITKREHISSQHYQQEATLFYLIKNNLFDYGPQSKKRQLIHNSKELSGYKGTCDSIEGDKVILFSQTKPPLLFNVKYHNFNYPQDIEFNYITQSSDQSYISINSKTKTVSILEQDFKSRKEWKVEKYKAEDKEECFVVSASVSKDDQTIHVCDMHNQKIKVYSKQGDFQFEYGGVGKGNGLFSRGSNYPQVILGPECITFFNGHMYVSDPGNNLIQVFKSSNGTFVNQIKLEEARVTQFFSTHDNLFIITNNESQILSISSQNPFKLVPI